MDGPEVAEYAKKALVVLVDRVSNYAGGRKEMTYGELGAAIGMPGPYNTNLFGKRIGEVLGRMGHLLDDKVIDGEPVPLIQALVVSSSTRLPSDGLKEFNATYPKLTTAKKRDFAANEYDRIMRFGTRWFRLLEQLDLIADASGNSTPQPSPQFGRHHRFGSEGSPEHRRLRDAILDDPSLVGLTLATWEAITEYPLRSGDSIDALIETKDVRYAIEVKSVRSGPDDIQRGLYQCVKYEAVLRAESTMDKDNREIAIILATSPKLQRNERRIASNLGLKYVDQLPAV